MTVLIANINQGEIVMGYEFRDETFCMGRAIRMVDQLQLVAIFDERRS
jgi:hypothetical protein